MRPNDEDTIVLFHVNLMMERRGYLLKENREREGVSVYSYPENKKEEVLVWISSHEKLNIDGIKEYVALLESYRKKHGILIFPTTITSSAKKVLENLYKFNIELFQKQEFMYDFQQLRYYSPHVRAEETVAQDLKKRFGSHLLLLLRTDPVCRYFGFEKGEIIKVQRKNGTIVYRLVK